MNLQTSQPNKALKESLFKRIETEGVCPRSRLFFTCQEYFVWSIWLLSVLIGALAVAVSLFVVTHHQYALYEATHENLFTFLVEVLPYIWMLVFGSMVYFAIYNLRHTKLGYRYSITRILLSSLILSFAGGSALQFFGLGYSIDNILGEQMPVYLSQVKLEQKMWQSPSEGRLIGKMVFATTAPTTTIIFEDISGQRWRMDISELSERDVALLNSSDSIRLLGEATNEELRIFHACGAFPWMVSRDVTMHDMSVERQAFIDEVYNHMRKGEEQLVVASCESCDTPTLIPESVCSNIAAVKRMPHEQN